MYIIREVVLVFVVLRGLDLLHDDQRQVNERLDEGLSASVHVFLRSVVETLLELLDVAERYAVHQAGEGLAGPQRLFVEAAADAALSA